MSVAGTDISKEDDAPGAQGQVVRELEDIRVRTMTNLVENVLVGDDPSNLLFLTNSQALKFGSESVSKMMHAFGIEAAPKVVSLERVSHYSDLMRQVIQLSLSLGSTEQEFFYDRDGEASSAGLHPTDLTRADVESSARKLEIFVETVILPLAINTQAIVLCEASNSCEMTAALGRVMQTKKFDVMPFTIIAVSRGFAYAIQITEKTTNVYSAIQQSKNWRGSVAEILESSALVAGSTDPNTWMDGNADLQTGLGNYVIVGCVRKKHGVPVQDAEPYKKVLGVILGHLGKDLPVVCFRTCRPGSVSLSLNLDLAQRGISTILLDSRSRPADIFTEPTLQARVDRAIAYHKEYAKKMRDMGSTDNFWSSTLAFFKAILNSQDDGQHQPGVRLPIWKFIETQSSDSKRENEEMTACVDKIVSHLVDEYRWDKWVCLPADQREVMEAQGLTYEDGTKDAHQWWSVCRNILVSPLIHGCSASDTYAGRLLTNSIVKIDRLPAQNSVEATIVLRDAWELVDICSQVASKNKKLANLFFYSALILGLAASVLTVGSLLEQTLSQVIVFGLSLGLSFLGGLNSYFNPQHRWKQLRHAEHSLRSEIIMFRTRTDKYAATGSNLSSYNRQCDATFQLTVADIRENILHAANLLETDFNFRFNPKNCSHGQTKISVPSGREQNKTLPITAMDDPDSIPMHMDDFHSPMRPHEYIMHRIQPHIEFLKERLPRYQRIRTLLNIVLLLLGLLSAVLSFVGLLHLVPLVVAVTASVTASQEFVGVNTVRHSSHDNAAHLPKRLVQALEVQELTAAPRYNSGIVGLRNLLLWWDSISEVEKASVPSINKLVLTSEQLIISEVAAWAATSSTNGSKDEEDKERDKEKENKAKSS